MSTDLVCPLCRAHSPSLCCAWGGSPCVLSAPGSREFCAHRAHLSLRIVAARLNGSLDFFSLETHTSLNHLQFRGEQGSPHSPILSLCHDSSMLQDGTSVLCRGQGFLGSSLWREGTLCTALLQCLSLRSGRCALGPALPAALCHLCYPFSKVCSGHWQSQCFPVSPFSLLPRSGCAGAADLLSSLVPWLSFSLSSAPGILTVPLWV